MKRSNLTNAIEALIAASKPFVVLQIVGTKKETIPYSDKTSGKSMSFSFFSHKAMTTGEEADFAIIRDNIPRGEDAEKATRPNFKGKQVLCLISGMMIDRKTQIVTYECNSMEVIEEDIEQN